MEETATPAEHGEERFRAQTDELASLLEATHRSLFPTADIGLLQRAYTTAEICHRGQMRKSGEPYVTHPLAVAQLLAERGADTITLVAALLHDTVEDTGYTLAELEATFGTEAALLVDGVTKLEGTKWGDRAEAETLRKILLTAADDLRVLVIKIADRVHNLRTLRFHANPEKRRRIARASLELLVPFAARLGLYGFKVEMEDLVFAVLEPERRDELRSAMQDSAPARAAIVEPLAGQLREALAAAGLTAEVIVKERGLYALHADRKRAVGSEPLVADATRVVICVDGSELDCYAALGIVHQLGSPQPGEFADFIAQPKFNMYRSLHTAVRLAGSDLLRVLIRNRAMDRVAENGILAHIQDAAQTATVGDITTGRRRDLPWLERLLTWEEFADSATFLTALRHDLPRDTIICFTPSSRPVRLPRDACAIDFAYAVKPELGYRMVGASANNRLIALTAPLKEGEVIEILCSTTPTGGPSPAWLRFVRTGRAQVFIQRQLDEAEPS